MAPGQSTRQKRLFRRLVLEKLTAAHSAGELQFFSKHAALANARAFAAYLAPLRNSKWVVYCKHPFGGPQQVLRYLARYTHRVAISNRRLLSLDDKGVTFKWKDYRLEGRERYQVIRSPPTSSSAAFSSTCCLQASIASATMACSPGGLGWWCGVKPGSKRSMMTM